MKEFKIELWPGYITSIRQHEADVLLCCEVSHKVRYLKFLKFHYFLTKPSFQVMRQETIYDILRNLKGEGGNWKDVFKKEIIGSTVLTSYNNKTYRVDDVDFNNNPQQKFMIRDKECNFIEYYKTRYNITIRDHNQPMLVVNPKASDIRAGRTDPILLIPEICCATGLTDKMRSNFPMMKAMAEHTQMDPERRTSRLLALQRTLKECQASCEQMEKFNMRLDSQLVTFQGRALNQEYITFGNEARWVEDDFRDFFFS